MVAEHLITHLQKYRMTVRKTQNYYDKILSQLCKITWVQFCILNEAVIFGDISWTNSPEAVVAVFDTSLSVCNTAESGPRFMYPLEL